MKTYKYIIIGGGMTGSSAVKGIRKHDPDGSIAMFTMESVGPYNRPPLTKGLWDTNDIASIMRPLDGLHVDLFTETTIVKIIPEQKQVTTEKGETFSYDKLLIAAGGSAIQLRDAPEGVIPYRTLADYNFLHETLKDKNEYCVIGGGFIGSELAAALTQQGKKVTMIFPEDGLAGRIFPDDLSAFLVDFYKKKGVRVEHNQLVDSITKNNERYTVQFHNTENEQVSSANFDVVISGVGIRPNVSLAQESEIEVTNGIVVNETLQTNFPDIFAAGDVANFLNKGLGKRVRIEHEDNANSMGLVAGENMAGETKKYDHFPFFYSDLFELGYEAVGEMDKNLEIYEDWVEPFKQGTIYYLEDGKIKGLIFWDLWGKIDKGRELIESGKVFSKSELKGLFK